MNCYEAIDLMDRALEHRVPPAARPGFDEHMGECPPCRHYLEQLEVTVRALGRLADATPPDAERRDRLARLFREHRRPTEN